MNTNKYDKYSKGNLQYTNNGWTRVQPSKYNYDDMNQSYNRNKGCGLVVMAGLLVPVVAYFVSTLIIH